MRPASFLLVLLCAINLSSQEIDSEIISKVAEYDSSFYAAELDDLLQGRSNKDAVLVISGGGARGAWGAGLITGMNDNNVFNFKHIIGTSTGALMAPFIALDRWDVLENTYTSGSVKKVLKPSIYSTQKEGMKFFPMFRGWLRNKNSVSSSHYLRNLIEYYLTDDEYDRLFDPGTPTVEVAVHSLDLGMTLYRTPDSSTTKDRFIDWVWASADQPVFMTPMSVFSDIKLISSGVPDSDLLRAPESPDDRAKREAKQGKIESYSTRKRLKKHRKKRNRRSIAVTSDPLPTHQDHDFEFPISSSNYYVDGGVSENLPLMRGLRLAHDDSIKNVVVVVNNKAPFALYDAPLLSGPNADENLEKWLNSDRTYERLVSSFFIGVDQLKLLFDPPVVHEGGFMIDYLKLDAIYDYEAGTTELTGRKLNKRKVEGIISFLLATIDGFSKEILINDIRSALSSPLAEGVTFHFFFMPLDIYESNPSSFGFDPERMKKQFEAGRLAKFVKQFDPEWSRRYALYFITGNLGHDAAQYLQNVQTEQVIQRRTGRDGKP